MEHSRVFNFSAGPSCLPIEVLKEIEENLINHQSSGMSVMEMSHRSKNFGKILEDTINTLKEVLSVPDSHKILFMHGGGTLQFSSVPLNFLPHQGALASYVVTGYWSQKAFDECSKFGKPFYAFNGASSKYTTVSDFSEWKIPEESSYLYYCTNETISGLELHDTPPLSSIPLIADMSSTLASKTIDVCKHSLIFASAQKNFGPSGSTIVIANQSSLGKSLPICPGLCDYSLINQHQSLFNTPCCWSIYVIGLVSKYIKKMGGLEYWEQHNSKKAKLLYDTIDESDGFYSCSINRRYRSNMNVTFNILGGDVKTEKAFLDFAKSHSLFELAGHRSMGGCRASIYNSFPIDGVYKLSSVMKEFQEDYEQSQD